ncbi:MAG TPA: PilZ domain-containing protein [Candidatus Angelobacter sp.]
MPAEAGTQRSRADRALRHQLRIPLRYRREGAQEWTHAETINISSSGVLFSSNELLEVDSRVEITFQTTGTPLIERSTRVATVVRRVLNNWPETGLVFGARFCL